MRSLDLLARYLAPRWPGVAGLAALVLAGVGLQLASPQILRSFIDATRTAAAPEALGAMALLYLAVELARRAIALGASYAGTAVGGVATNALRSDLLRHCLFLDMPFHKRHSPGELVERLGGDVGALANFFAQFGVRLLSSGLLVVGVLVLLFREDWRVGLGLSVYAGLTFAVLRAIQPLAVRRRAAAREASAAQTGFLEERLRGTEDIRANGAEAHVLARADELSRTLLLKQRAAELVSEVTFVASNFLFAAGTAVGLVVGALLYARGEATVGTAFLIVAYAGMLFEPLESIREQAQDFQAASAGIERIAAILAERSEIRDAVSGGASAPTDGPLAVVFDRVSFRYRDGVADEYGTGEAGRASEVNDAGEAVVLEDISFSLAAGRALGLLGRTGSGKTTLTRLLFRLYDPAAGNVRLGDTDLRDVRLAELRRRVALVTQDVQLFHSSVRDNVAFFDPSVPDKKIVATLEEVGLGPWYRALPQGLDTPLEAGSGLSAGEAQLLAFARVFLKQPSVVILDEPSSRLDPATERLLERATDRLLAGRTAIVIAHRLETIRRVDDVLILERGRVREHGRREILERDPSSRYAHLLRAGIDPVLEGGSAASDGDALVQPADVETRP